MTSNSISTNFKDSFPKILRSVSIEAFSKDYDIIMAELERLRTATSRHVAAPPFMMLSATEFYSKDTPP